MRECFEFALANEFELVGTTFCNKREHLVTFIIDRNNRIQINYSMVRMKDLDSSTICKIVPRECLTTQNIDLSQ